MKLKIGMLFVTILILALSLPIYIPVIAQSPQELIGLRTQTSKTFLIGEDKFRTEIATGAMHYKDSEGNWQDIEINEYETETGDFTARFTKLPYVVRMGDDSRRRIYPDRNDLSYWIEFSKPFPNMGLPIKEGGFWVWKYPNATIKVRVDNTQVKFNFIIKNALAPTSISLPYTSQGITRNGRYLLHDGEVVAEMTRPYAIDALGEERAVDVNFKPGKVTLSLDTTGLTYPIDVDPTLNLQVGASADDCLVVSRPAWEIRTASLSQRVGYNNPGFKFVGGGMRFLNVTIPNAATIDSANITLTCRNASALVTVNSVIHGELAANATAFSTIANYQSRRGTVVGGADNSNITTNNVTWDNIGAWVVDTEYTSPDITTVIQEIVNQGGWVSGNNLVIFWDDHAARGTQNLDRVRTGHSWNNDNAKAPKLDITYSLPPIHTTLDSFDAVVVGDNATFSANITSTGGAANCTARGFVWDTTSHANPGDTTPAASAYTSNWTENGSFATGTFNHIATSLTQLNTYYFRAFARNSIGDWVYSEEREFFIGETGKVYLEFRPDLDETRIRGNAGIPTDAQAGIFNGYSLPVCNSQDDEELYFLMYVPDRWDEESNILVRTKVWTSGNESNNLYELQVAWDKVTPNVVEAIPTGAPYTVNKTRTVYSELTYACYLDYFVLDYDIEPTDPIIADDTIALRIRRIDTGSDNLSGELVLFEVSFLFARGDFMADPTGNVTAIIDDMIDDGTLIGGKSMLFLSFIVLALGLMGACYAWKKPVLGFGAAGGWLFLGVYSYTLVASEGQLYWALFVFCVGMIIVSVLEAMGQRGVKEIGDDWEADDEMKEIEETMSEFETSMKRANKPVRRVKKAIMGNRKKKPKRGRGGIFSLRKR
jgi:hypothetical protein